MNTKYNQEIINAAKDLLDADKIANDALVEKWDAESRFVKIRSLWHSDKCEKNLYLIAMDNLELANEQLKNANRKFEIALKEFRVITHSLWAIRDTDPASLLNEAIVIIEESKS